MITLEEIDRATPEQRGRMLREMLVTVVPYLIAKTANGSPSEDRLITAKQAAEMLHVNETWIYRRKETLPFVKPDMKPLRCSFLKVQQYIHEGGQG